MAKLGFKGIAVLVLLTAIIIIAMVQMGFAYKDIGLIKDSGTSLVSYDFSSIPQSVMDDANRIARDLFGAGDKYREFVDQLLAAYIEARDTDFVLVFNPGGWGVSHIDDAPGWESIIDGIRSELDKAGFVSIILDYQRTTASIRGRWEELVEILNHYPFKSTALAGRVQFLTDNIPHARVIVTGESNGSIISDYTMSRLKDNKQVYSILTGTPFWHTPGVHDRTLLLNDNGVRPDSLSHGELASVITNTLKEWLHLAPPQDQAHAGHNIDAPGHDYSWDYPVVYTKITDFLNQNFVNNGDGTR